MVIFVIAIRPRGISRLVSGLDYVTRDVGYNIHMGAKLYSLGRMKVFSSVATNLELSTTMLPFIRKLLLYWIFITIYRYRVKTRQDTRFVRALVNIVTLFCNFVICYFVE